VKIIFLMLVSSILAVGCSSVSQVGAERIDKSEVVTLIDYCNSECQVVVAQKFTFPMAQFLFSKDKPVRSYGVLSAVDGVRGAGKYYDPKGAFNNTWDGKFTVKTSPGKKSILINPTSIDIAPNKEQLIEFIAKPGTTYVVASMGWREMRGVQINYWSPLIYDVDNNKIIFPEGQPKWVKYCTLNKEFSGMAECP
jgi:hypothetical protein